MPSQEVSTPLDFKHKTGRIPTKNEMAIRNKAAKTSTDIKSLFAQQ